MSPGCLKSVYVNRSRFRDALITTGDAPSADATREVLMARLSDVRKKYDEIGLFAKVGECFVIYRVVDARWSRERMVC